ncbi:MAG TPA: hypothetical protein V6C78_10735 [Crinalium sp.]|jgi:hypothetical protein
MYLAEFSFPGTTELANELLIQASSEAIAQTFAQTYANHWGIELYSLLPVTDSQIGLNRLAKAIAIAS